MSKMTASVAWRGEEQVNFDAKSGSGHSITADPNTLIGAKPTELVLMGLGSCASVDVVGILKKSRQDITGVICEVSANRADTIPAVFTDIHLHFVVTGRNVKAAQVAKAIELSATKYCSVSKMLEAGGVIITHDYTIVDVDTDVMVNNQ